MDDELLASIKLFAGNFVPMGYMLCNGASLPVNNNNAALFSLLSNLYGGDGVHTFCLPDLRPVDATGHKRNWNPNEPKYIIATVGIYPSRD